MRKLPFLIAILLFGVAARFAVVHRHQPASPPAVKFPPAIAVEDTRPAEAEPGKPAPGLPPQPAPIPTVASVSPEPTMQQTVFRLQLDRDRCTLENVEQVTGAFGRERAMTWHAGMLCCRLLADDGRIVGERTLPAPDHVCVVLDPNDASGQPTAARLTSDGPAVFQVRFPETAGAVRLEVYRIALEARPSDAATPIGPMLASIAIPVR